MTWFQNPFNTEFRGSLVLGDRAHSPTFVLPGNPGRSDKAVVLYGDAPFDLSGNDADGNPKDTLTIQFSSDYTSSFKNWGIIEVDVTSEAASASAVSKAELYESLIADTLFTDYFSVDPDFAGESRLKISAKKSNTEFRFFVRNGGAEEVLLFNKKAGVAELPAYFGRHVVSSELTEDEKLSYTDNANVLVTLDPDAAGGSRVVDDSVISNAVDSDNQPLNYDNTVVQEDWELLRGRSGMFQFRKQVVDGSDRVTEVIEYSAGAKPGDLCMKKQFVYTGGNTTPSSELEFPHVLTSGDLISPA